MEKEKRIRAGIIGAGYIGVSHMEAVRRIGFGELMAVADTNIQLAQKKQMNTSFPAAMIA